LYLLTSTAALPGESSTHLDFMGERDGYRRAEAQVETGAANDSPGIAVTTGGRAGGAVEDVPG
jgi:hypothetical protein